MNTHSAKKNNAKVIRILKSTTGSMLKFVYSVERTFLVVRPWNSTTTSHDGAWADSGYSFSNCEKIAKNMRTNLSVAMKNMRTDSNEKYENPSAGSNEQELSPRFLDHCILLTSRLRKM